MSGLANGGMQMMARGNERRSSSDARRHAAIRSGGEDRPESRPVPPSDRLHGSVVSAGSMETVFVPLELAGEAGPQVDVRLPPEKTSSGVGRSARALDVAWLGSLLIDD